MMTACSFSLFLNEHVIKQRVWRSGASMLGGGRGASHYLQPKRGESQKFILSFGQGHIYFLDHMMGGGGVLHIRVFFPRN